MAKAIKKTEISLKDMTIQELVTKAGEIKAAILKSKLDKSVGRLKNLKVIYNLRKQLARILTVKNGVKSTEK